VWTAVKANGTAAIAACAAWLAEGSDALGGVGMADKTDATWTDSTPNQSCNVPAHLYCFEQ
jgi:hypothetical protein